MTNYSIVRIGNEYVVQVDDMSILKIASRRRAAKLVILAAELLELDPAPTMPQVAHTGPSIAADPGIIPDDPGSIPDPGIVPDPAEVP
jgi:hypothetical protein